LADPRVEALLEGDSAGGHDGMRDGGFAPLVTI
jgi:hypothetical protein